MENILFVTVDSLRADHLGCYGYERNTSPNLDSLAADGHQFTNAFSHAGATRSSFPAILSSEYPSTYGSFYSLSDERTLVSEPLQLARYDTAGYNSNPYLSAEFGYDRGFDTLSDWSDAPSWTARLRQIFKDNLDRNGTAYRFLKWAFTQTEQKAGIEVGSLYTPADDLTDAAVEWIEDHPDDGNFLWVHYMDVHHPYVPPKEHQQALGQQVTSERRALRLRRKLMESPAEATEDEWAEVIDLYDAEIRFTDHEIGRLLDRATDTWGDEAVVLFTADHGEEFDDHGQFGHPGTFYEELIHVPLLVSADGSGVYDELVGLVDLAPTILDYAGVEIPAGYYGSNLRPLMADGNYSRKAVASKIDDKVFYRTDDWKYIRYGDEEELYDIQVDPEETDNLATERPDMLEQLREQARRHPVVTEERSDDGNGERVELAEETKDQLKALGYKE